MCLQPVANHFLPSITSGLRQRGSSCLPVRRMTLLSATIKVLWDNNSKSEDTSISWQVVAGYVSVHFPAYWTFLTGPTREQLAKLIN